MLSEKRKILIISLIGGFALWVIDAVIDSLFFSRQSFINTLVLDIEPHELYFRSLFLVSFVLFGFITAQTLAKRNQAQEELKGAFARLEEEKARSESIVNAIGDGISIQGRQLEVLYQNRVHKELVGGDREGQICYRAYSDRDSPCPGCPVLLSFADGGIHTLKKKLVRSSVDRMIEIKASPLRDSTGRIVAAIEAVRDITERKKATEKLRLFSTAIEVAMDGVQIVDLNGQIMYSNRAVGDLYGFAPEELQGRHVSEMNADPEFSSRVILPCIKEFGRWSGEVNVHHKDGHVFPIWLSTSLVTGDSGSPIAMIGIIRDITERKQAEDILNRHREKLVKLVEERTVELTEANAKLRREIADREKMEEELLKAQKLESLGILAGGIAHDFNNLLASMLGNISLAMLDIGRVHPAYNQLAAAEKASIRAQDLTRQLLTFSKGGAPLKKTTDISELVREASGFALRGSRVKCDITIDKGHHLADVDEGQISQVVHNLVINADHAMPEGGTIKIHCSTARIDKKNVLAMKSGEYVVITVKDDGVGIPREHFAKIFDPYFTTKQKGSGLGLATTYSIIKKHGGHIAVDSKLGSGTTFSVYLPASAESIPANKQEELSVLKGSGSILVMDDEPDVRETTGNVLKRLGYTVDFASDGQEAIDVYVYARERGKPYDVIIMDLTVPGGMGGKEAILKLREIDPSVKAIVASGYSNDPIMADFIKYGFAGVVVKPFRIKDFSMEVSKVMNGKI